MLGPLAAGVALLTAFFYVEARVAQAPLVPLQIFRIRQLRAANLIVVLMYAANFPAWFFITLYLQQVLHYTAIEAGLAFLPMTLSIFTGSTLAPRVVARFGRAPVIVTAMTVMAAAGWWRSAASPRARATSGPCSSARCSPPLGMGFSLVPSTIVAMQGVAGSAERRGVGAAQHQPADGRRAGPGHPLDDRQRPYARRDRDRYRRPL